ncbi:LacI family DNA-binding transcriptional regulator [bacterium]|nr:LacI family DNA-binding transcriptional regulator [bacterium]
MSQVRITITQVARSAGVSKQTVSRVLNEHPDVADETRRRVQQVVDALGYRPSSIARSLSRGKSQTLGVVGYGLEYFGTSRILSGIEQEADQLGYTVLLNLIRQPEDNDPYPILDKLAALHVNGIIWAAPEIGNNRTWIDDISRAVSVPIVYLSTRPRPNQLVVNMDNRSGGYTATQHLIQQGRRKIGLITGPLHWWDALQRRLGWQDALLAADLPVDESLLVEGDWSAASGEVAFQRLLTAHPDLDAVFACNDQMALGVIHAAHADGRRIPSDLALVGFDNIPEAAFFTPSLTTMHQDVVALGRRSVEAFAHLFDGRQLPAQDDGSNLLLPAHLVVRESSV